MSNIKYNLHYSKYHDFSNDNVFQMASYFWKSIEKDIPKDRTAKILEIGCGTGFCLYSLEKKGYINFHGIDIDKSQITIARNISKHAEYVPLSAQYKFFHDRSNYYDCIIAFDVLEHVPISEQLNLLELIKNSLKCGGIFICQVPNSLSPVSTFQRYVDWTHTCSFTSDSIEFLFLSIGLKLKNIRPSLDPVPRRSILVGFLVNIFKLFIRFFVRGLWRVVIISELGLGRGITAPITPNFVCVAIKPLVAKQ